MRISDWSSDVCSSDLIEQAVDQQQVAFEPVGVALVGLVVVVARAVLRDHRQALPLLGPVVLVAAVVVVAAFGDADLEKSRVAEHRAGGGVAAAGVAPDAGAVEDRKSTRLNSSH